MRRIDYEEKKRRQIINENRKTKNIEAKKTKKILKQKRRKSWKQNERMKQKGRKD